MNMMMMVVFFRSFLVDSLFMHRVRSLSLWVEFVCRFIIDGTAALLGLGHS